MHKISKQNCVADKSPVEKLFLQAESEGRTTACTTVFTVKKSWLTDRTSRLSSHSSGGQVSGKLTLLFTE
ncbi:hypothetical protein AMECASPLE_012111 [Ameca splendens]|uniref:Uncharacterized protein n=1 Tax=Ameca splendens TaxID=208324 RepID=A0ABV0YNC6_9TELE